MSNEWKLEAQIPEEVVLCDHRCLLDEGHVERGETHQYGYLVGRSGLPAARIEALLRLEEAVERAEFFMNGPIGAAYRACRASREEENRDGD